MNTYNFGESIQDELTYNIITDTNFMRRIDGLVKPEYFDNVSNGIIVDIALAHFKKYKQAIQIKSLVQELKEKSDKKIIRDDIKDIVKDKLNQIFTMQKLVAKEKLIDDIVVFAKHQAVQKAFVDCVPKLENGDFSYIEKTMKNALQVGASSEFETYSYFGSINERMENRRLLLLGKAKEQGITTGIPELDNCLRSKGWGKRELSLIMGGPKTGKTMGLVNFGLNAALAGYNVLYISLEVSKDIISERCDANLADIKINDLSADLQHIQTTESVLKQVMSKAGILDIQEFPTGQMKASDIRRLVEKRQADLNINYDLLVVDYADIMRPEMNFSEKRDGLTSIYEDLRAIGQHYDLAVLTATQTNREGVKAKVADMTHVAEDLGKIRTADIVISINCTDEEKMLNEARLFFAASRTGEMDITLKIKRDISKGKFITKVLAKS
jgi:replicative DNA helicase